MLTCPPSFALLVQLLVTFCAAQYPLDEFTPFGTDAGDVSLYGGFGADDAAVELPLPQTLPFFDAVGIQTAYICENGYISFNISDCFPVPLGFPDLGFYIAAAYWTDLLVVESESNVWARATTTQTDTLELLSANVRKVFSSSFTGCMAIVVTYERLATYVDMEKRLTFQINIITDGDNSFAFFYYNDLDGVVFGLAGVSQGFEPVKAIPLPYGLTPTSNDLQFDTNIGQTGAWAVPISDGFTIEGNLTDVDPADPPPDFCATAPKQHNPHPTICRAFISCPNAHTHFCKKPHNFNPLHSVCVWKSQYDCDTVNFCSGKPDGLYADPDTCYGFISCSNELKHRYPCPGNTKYNPLVKYCDWPGNVACPP